MPVRWKQSVLADENEEPREKEHRSTRGEMRVWRMLEEDIHGCCQGVGGETGEDPTVAHGWSSILAVPKTAMTRIPENAIDTGGVLRAGAGEG